MRRIFYYGGVGSKKPSGGYAILLQHIRWLRAEGFDAHLLVDEGFNPKFELPLDDVSIFKVGEHFCHDDILVVPEPDLRPIGALRGDARLWICCQGYQNIFNTADSANAWNYLNLDGIITTSETVRAYVSRHFPNIRLASVRCGIEEKFFSPKTQISKTPNSVAIMPRKRPLEAKFIRMSFELRYPNFPIEWMEIDNISRDDVSKVLKKSVLFVYLGRTEGLGLPGLEAMAAGAVVIGFNGTGVCDYARSNNGYWSNPEQFDRIIDDVYLALTLHKNHPTGLDQIRLAARETARYYHEDRAKRVFLNEIKKLFL